MTHCVIFGCNNKYAKNPEKSYYIGPKDKNIANAWYAAIKRGKSNLPSKLSNIRVCSDHFKESDFDKTWELQKRLYYKDRPIKRKLLSNAVPSVFPYKEPEKWRTSSEKRALKKEMIEVNIF